MFEERWDLGCKEEEECGVIEARAAIFSKRGRLAKISAAFALLSMNWSEMKLRHLVW